MKIQDYDSVASSKASDLKAVGPEKGKR